MSRGQVETLYEQADYVVLPSAFEGYGLPFAEAVIRAKPIISSSIAPFMEQKALYEYEACRMFNPMDSRSLTGLLRDAINQPWPGSTDFRPWSSSDMAKAYLKHIFS